NLGFADGRFPAADALEEIAHVIVALVEPGGAVGQRVGKKFLFAGGNFATCNENPAVGAQELNSVGRGLALADDIAVGQSVFIDDSHGHTVGVFEIDLILRGGVVAARNHLLQGLTAHFDRAATLGAVA